jgi:hypothetical protein
LAGDSTKETLDYISFEFYIGIGLYLLNDLSISGFFLLELESNILFLFLEEVLGDY